MTRIADPAEPFVYDSWCRSLIDALTDDEQRTFELANVLAASLNGTLHAATRKYVQQVVQRQSTRVWIAGAADDPQTLIGWVAAEPARVHYTYVKKRLRGHGIARDLLEHAACDLGQFTSTSTLTRDWIREKASANGISYSPSFRGEHAEKAADRIVA